MARSRGGYFSMRSYSISCNLNSKSNNIFLVFKCRDRLFFFYMLCVNNFLSLRQNTNTYNLKKQRFILTHVSVHDQSAAKKTQHGRIARWRKKLLTSQLTINTEKKENQGWRYALLSTAPMTFSSHQTILPTLSHCSIPVIKSPYTSADI